VRDFYRILSGRAGLLPLAAAALERYDLAEAREV